MDRHSRQGGSNEGNGAEVQSRDNEQEQLPQLPQVNMGDLMNAQMQMLQAALGANRGHAPSKMAEFMRLKPPTYEGNMEDPMTADDWLREIVKKLRIVSASEEEKVALAWHQLTGPAAEWWDNYCEAAADMNLIDWEEFEQAFREYHIPEGIIDMKKEEFRKPHQGSMTVNQYLKKFTQLARYAPGEVDTDKKKQERFKKGLRGPIRTHTIGNMYPDFNTLMNRSILLEESINMENNDRKRKFQEHQERVQRQRTNSAPRHPPRPVMQLRTPSANLPPTPRLTMSQNRAPTRSNTTVNQAQNLENIGCFYCGDTGHRVAICPYRNAGVPLPNAGTRPANSMTRAPLPEEDSSALCKATTTEK